MMETLRRRTVEQLTAQRAVASFVVAIVFTVTSTLSVILRLIALRIKKRKPGWEDYTILAAQVSCFSVMAEPNICTELL